MEILPEENYILEEYKQIKTRRRRVVDDKNYEYDLLKLSLLISFVALLFYFAPTQTQAFQYSRIDNPNEYLRIYYTSGHANISRAISISNKINDPELKFKIQEKLTYYRARFSDESRSNAAKVKDLRADLEFILRAYDSVPSQWEDICKYLDAAWYCFDIYDRRV